MPSFFHSSSLSSHPQADAASSEPFTITLPSRHAVHTPNSLVQGTVQLDAGACMKDNISEVTLKVCCKQTSTFYRSYGQSQDYRKQTVVLYEESFKIWSPGDQTLGGEPTSSFASIPASPPETNVLSKVFKGKSKELSPPPSTGSTSAAFQTTPFAFLLPASPNDLPPTFEGGSRWGGTWTKGKASGREMGHVRWFVKVVGTREGLLKRNRRKLVLFIYSPSLTTPSSAIPPSLLAPADGTAPHRPGRMEGWRTYSALRARREGLFGKKGLVVTHLALPDLPSYPSPKLIPFHLTLHLLSPPLPSPSSTSSATLPKPPNPTEFKLQLVRTVWTKAQGAHQTFDQLASEDVINLDGRLTWVGEKKVYGAEHWVGVEEAEDKTNFDESGDGKKKYGEEDDDDDDGQEDADGAVAGEVRLGQIFVVVGTMKFSVGPSFDRGVNPKGNLTCSYSINVVLPISSKLSSKSTTPLVPNLKITSTFPEGQGVPPLQAIEQDLEGGEEDEAGLAGLPGYFDVVGKEGDGWDDEKEEK